MKLYHYRKEPYLDIGLLEFIQGDYQKAKESLEKGIRQDPGNQRLAQTFIDKARTALDRSVVEQTP